DAPPGDYNEPYTFTFVAEGGAGDFEFSVGSGDLPEGLNLASDGTLSGTPKQVGTFEVTIVVTDGDDVSEEVTIEISIGRHRWIAYASNKTTGGTDEELFVVDIANNLYPESNLSAPVGGTTNIHQVAFSPGGEYLAFIATEGDDTQVFVSRLSSGVPEAPLPLETFSVLNNVLLWSPDGRYLAYSRDDDHVLHVANFSSGLPESGTAVGEGYLASWASATRLVFANAGFTTLNFSTMNDGVPSSPQSIIVGAELNGLLIDTDVGGEDVVAVKAPLDPCYQENYL